MTVTSTLDRTAAAATSTTRWGYLAICIICMVMIANLQYGWTLFVNPINKAHGWSIASIQFAFAVFIALETWLTPIEGWIVDVLGPQRGPKLMVAFGGIMVATGWVINAYAMSLGDALSRRHRLRHRRRRGLRHLRRHGGQMVSGPARPCGRSDRGGLWRRRGAHRHSDPVCDRQLRLQRGFPLVRHRAGRRSSSCWHCCCAAPEAGEMAAAPPPKVAQAARSSSPREVLLSPVFWLLYIMFVMVSASGLMATAQIAPIAADFNVGKQIVFWGATTLTAALIIDNIANGTARPLFGWVSDHIGRELTMAIAFGLGGVAYWLLGSLGTAPWAFVLFAALIFLTWGEIFSLFPSTCTDTFGPKFATVNLSLLYTAKGTSAFLVPVANLIKVSTGCWHMVFVVTALMNFVVVGLALFVLKPTARAGDATGLRSATLGCE